MMYKKFRIIHNGHEYKVQGFVYILLFLGEWWTISVTDKFSVAQEIMEKNQEALEISKKPWKVVG